jgi:beta-lactam-binding protein with PASTA domain
VPNVIGLPFAQAQKELNQVGLRASEVTTSGPLDDVGTVQSEAPTAGTRAKVGSLVVLTVVIGTG